MTQLRAAVFDMDGILIDSEPFWFEAECEVFKTIGLDLTDELYQETMGLRISEVVAHWMSRYPWDNRSTSDVAQDVQDGVVSRVRDRGTTLPGVREAISFFRSQGMRIGLATSSDESVIDAVLGTLGLEELFDDTYSAQHEERGKPDPAVYLRAAERLGFLPNQCVAIEDSLNGIKSAKAAGLACIAVPDRAAWKQGPERFEIADVVLDSLVDLDENVLSRLQPAPLELPAETNTSA